MQIDLHQQEVDDSKAPLPGTSASRHADIICYWRHLKWWAAWRSFIVCLSESDAVCVLSTRFLDESISTFARHNIFFRDVQLFFGDAREALQRRAAGESAFHGKPTDGPVPPDFTVFYSLPDAPRLEARDVHCETLVFNGLIVGNACNLCLVLLALAWLWSTQRCARDIDIDIDTDMDVSQNGSTPQWMVSNGTSC